MGGYARQASAVLRSNRGRNGGRTNERSSWEQANRCSFRSTQGDVRHAARPLIVVADSRFSLTHSGGNDSQYHPQWWDEPEGWHNGSARSPEDLNLNIA